MLRSIEQGMSYDVVVIGSGLAGLTAANYLAKLGFKVGLFEQHYVLGGLAAYFKRGDHIFDVSLHGFPYGMVKSCRKYWSPEIAESIIQLKRIRFSNPQFDVETTFSREDFLRILINQFHINPEIARQFFVELEEMNFYDSDQRKTQEIFDKFFPKRDDVHRFLMEPIAYANGSTTEDEAITYGIVFSNFMNKGVFTFQGGTDELLKKMQKELLQNGVDIFTKSKIEKILIKDRKVEGVVVNGIPISCRSVLSNSHILNTVKTLVGENYFSKKFVDLERKVRVNNSSCQVYIGIRKNESIDDVGDLIFTSENQHFSSFELKDFYTKSRTFSFYYPKTRPQQVPMYSIVASMNANWEDWAGLSPEQYNINKRRVVEESVSCLEKFVPDIRKKIDYLEAATPKTFNRYTGHPFGTSFGTKFEGLQLSTRLPEEIKGLYHAGSVGIIMSGWLGAMNYGVIVAHKLASSL